MNRLMTMAMVVAAWIVGCQECPAQAVGEMGTNQSAEVSLTNAVPVMVLNKPAPGSVVLLTTIENIGTGPLGYTWGDTNGVFHFLPAGAIVSFDASTPIYDPLFMKAESTINTVVRARRDMRKSKTWPR